MSNSFVTPWPVAFYSSLSMRFPSQEYWNWLPFLSLRDLLNLRIKLLFPALRDDFFFFFFFTTEAAGKAYRLIIDFHCLIMAPHYSTPAWKIPWMEEPGRLQSLGSLRVGHDWAASLSLSCIGEGNGNPFQCSCLENPRDGGAWWAAIYGVAQSWTRLKQLSSSSSSIITNFFLVYTYIV